MNKGRLEAFSDGVIAIIITIMVLEMKVPHGETLSALGPLVPVFLSYVLSFIYVGIYWNNHHHMLKAARSISAPVMWANMHLLFWLSLVPFATAWMGENEFKATPVAAYGGVLLLSGCAYFILAQVLIRLHGVDSVLARAIGRDRKGLASLALYGAAIALAFVDPRISCGLYVVVAVVWLVPDRRIARNLAE
jgi:uncharacterized membrane protein